MMEIFEILKALDTSISVIVLVYFGDKVTKQVGNMIENNQNITMRVLDLCLDDDDDDDPPSHPSKIYPYE